MSLNHSTTALASDSSVQPPPATSAAVTVIVPVFNSSSSLQRSLAALMESKYEHVNVLVVDDGSTEPIKSLVDGFGGRYLRIDGPGGPARARNRGAEKAETDFVIFIDADVCVHSDTIGRFMRAFAEDPGLSAVVGTYDDAPAEPGLLSQYRNLLHHYTHCRSAGQIMTFWAGCGAMRRDVFLKYGGFDEQRYRCPAIEDIELGTWISADGHRILLDPHIRCKHLKRWSFWNMVKTDVFQRGVLWIDLMLRSGKAVRNLNVNWLQRMSVVLMFVICVFAVLVIWSKWALVGVATAAITLTLLNMDFYRLLASRRGLWFAVRAWPFHCLYFVCCGLSIPLGILKHWQTRRAGRRMKSSPL